MPTGRATVEKQREIIRQLTNPGTLQNGEKLVTIAGTAESLGGDVPLISGVTVKALSGNTGNVFIGGSAVDSSNGYIFEPGNKEFIPASNLNTVFIDSENNGDGVRFIGN